MFSTHDKRNRYITIITIIIISSFNDNNNVQCRHIINKRQGCLIEYTVFSSINDPFQFINEPSLIVYPLDEVRKIDDPSLV